MIRENKIKNMLREGKSVIGTFVKLTDPCTIEILALSGFDFIIIDNEHTAMSKESMVNLIRTSEISGIVPTVRVRENSAAEILQALDAGALGVQVPQVDNYQQARDVVDRVKYAPIGKRGFISSHRACGYGSMDPIEYVNMTNDNTLIVSYCETAEGIKNLDEILRIDEIDVIFMGPNDLSQALGVIGQSNHPKVIEAMDYITKKTLAAGKTVGTIASDSAKALELIEKGIKYISLSSDIGLLNALAKRYVGEIKG